MMQSNGITVTETGVPHPKRATCDFKTAGPPSGPPICKVFMNGEITMGCFCENFPREYSSNTVTTEHSAPAANYTLNQDCVCTGVFSARMLCCAEKPKDMNCTYDNVKNNCVQCPHGVDPKAPFQCLPGL